MTEPEPQVGTASFKYDGTAASRIQIRNWMRATDDDPGTPFVVELQPGVFLELGDDETITRNPNGTFGIEEAATNGDET